MTDKELIEKLGGVKAIVDALGYNYTTVHNWLTRGISRDAKIAYPEIFMQKIDFVSVSTNSTWNEKIIEHSQKIEF